MELKHIHPYGFTANFFGLLIVPYGIETINTNALIVNGGPFNCTLWN